MTGDTPVALVLTRQDLPLYEKSGADALKGGYISPTAKAPPTCCSWPAVPKWNSAWARRSCSRPKASRRVISMPSFELFEAQSDEYKESILPANVRARVAVEAAATFGWHKYVGLDGAVIGLDHFGASRPYKLLSRSSASPPRTWPRPPRRSSAELRSAR